MSQSDKDLQRTPEYKRPTSVCISHDFKMVNEYQDYHKSCVVTVYECKHCGLRQSYPD